MNPFPQLIRLRRISRGPMRLPYVKNLISYCVRNLSAAIGDFGRGPFSLDKDQSDQRGLAFSATDRGPVRVLADNMIVSANPESIDSLLDEYSPEDTFAQPR